jgi:hypothetical protein
MINSDKSDYRRGLLYFCGLLVCICLFFTTPDGESIFYRILGLFGIKPGIAIGSNSTLYVYWLIPIAAAIICIKKALKYWQGYGLKFKKYNYFLRVLPIIIIVPVFLVSTNMVSPSGIDRIYYAVVSQRSGLQAVTYSSADNFIEYQFSGSAWTYSYNITLENHGKDTLAFNIKLIPDRHERFREAFIRDSNGEVTVFILRPRERSSISGRTIEHHYQSTYGSGKGSGTFSVVLINDYEQTSPDRITRR